MRFADRQHGALVAQVDVHLTVLVAHNAIDEIDIDDDPTVI